LLNYILRISANLMMFKCVLETAICYIHYM